MGTPCQAAPYCTLQSDSGCTLQLLLSPLFSLLLLLLLLLPAPLRLCVLLLLQQQKLVLLLLPLQLLPSLLLFVLGLSVQSQQIAL